MDDVDFATLDVVVDTEPNTLVMSLTIPVTEGSGMSRVEEVDVVVAGGGGVRDVEVCEVVVTAGGSRRRLVVEIDHMTANVPII